MKWKDIFKEEADFNQLKNIVNELIKREVRLKDISDDLHDRDLQMLTKKDLSRATFKIIEHLKKKYKIKI